MTKEKRFVIISIVIALVCWCGSMAEQLICNQQVDGSTPFTSSIYLGEFPSGQRGQTVNLLSLTSLVRIQLPPPNKNTDPCGRYFYLARSAIRTGRSLHSLALPRFFDASDAGPHTHRSRRELAHARRDWVSSLCEYPASKFPFSPAFFNSTNNPSQLSLIFPSKSHKISYPQTLQYPKRLLFLLRFCL